ncbi:MmgE/PrpD family protein [Advenella mimigardefordensis]|uniref:Putative 2-methylcitrate dehydratase PrpD n=1 Tax=Advenella mimigardefordensis (strain DSM 17166 / LMG 22922 / DPN7) TaxID=1247726 RepID=W0P9D9_ADVMD|nr:MmgE/PrpD family protein [Advenella mimigardefordensis]AHG63469.1 putative 2-methylcitrate dehydratase PrpD [Advenella mimigardefordensis DPN7]
MKIKRRALLLGATALPLSGHYPAVAQAVKRNGLRSEETGETRIKSGRNATVTGMMLDAIERRRFEQVPAAIIYESKRALVNWFGCVLGAAQSDPVNRAAQTVGSGTVPIYGTTQNAQAKDAAFLTCLSSAVYAFDDTHVPTITHPTGPIASVLLALAHSEHKLSGQQFLSALIAGIEFSCKLANALTRYAPEPNFGLYLTGVTGPIGAAAAGAIALGLDRASTGWAIGLAATQAAGLRATHGAMSGMVVPAFSASAGLQAVLLAQAGFTSTAEVISGERGLIAAYAPGADWDAAFSGLGEDFEIRRVSYKPYPCGVVIHPLLNVLKSAALSDLTNTNVQGVEVRVSKRTKTLTDNAAPTDMFAAIVSAQHWVALAILGHPLGVNGLQQEQIDDPEVSKMRKKIKLVSDDALEVTDCVITLQMNEHAPVTLHGNKVDQAEMTLNDVALKEKYMNQGRGTMDQFQLEKLLALLLNIEQSKDIGRDISAIFRPVS